MFNIYRNLHKDCFSIQLSRRVCLHTPSFAAEAAYLHVNQAGRARVIATRHKTVHALVCVERLIIPLSATVRAEWLALASPSDKNTLLKNVVVVPDEAISQAWDMHRDATITYNPYTHETFCVNGRPAQRAQYVAGRIVSDITGVHAPMCTLKEAQELFPNALVLTA